MKQLFFRDLVINFVVGVFVLAVTEVLAGDADGGVGGRLLSELERPLIYVIAMLVALLAAVVQEWMRRRAAMRGDRE